MIRYPAKLPEGATIGVVCPSSSISTARIAQCVETLNALGYRVKLADNLDCNPHEYIAGPGRARAEWINRMFADPEVDAILCARGGDGSSRIMEYLDYDCIARNPKIFCGFSDVTNLLLALPQRCNLVAFHGPMVSSNMVDHFDDETRASFFAAVNAEGSFEYRNPVGKPLTVWREGRAEGILTGGNLCLLVSSIGTPYEVDCRGKILFVEEVHERISSIERWFMHLRNCGKLAQCAGILLGQFTDITIEEAPEYETVARYLYETGMFDGLDIPIVSGVETGHGHPMMTLPMGAPCTLDTNGPHITFAVNR